MKPIRIELPKEMFDPSALKHYEEHSGAETLVRGGVEYFFPDGIDWEADITNTGGAFLVRGKAEGVASTECARCLEVANVDVEGEIEGYFLISSEGDDPEDMEADEFDRLGEDKVIDMAPLIESALLLELPQVVFCKDDCKGLCYKCGANLNEGECTCDLNDAADDTNPFAVLKGVKFDN